MGGTTTAVRPTAMRAAQGPSSGTTRTQRWLDRQFVRFAVLPTSAMMLLIFGVPLVFSLYLSFEGWSPEQALFAGNFAGTANYEDLLTDPQFLQSLRVTCIYTTITVSTELAFGLGIALLLNIDLPWIGFFRTASAGSRRCSLAGSFVSRTDSACDATDAVVARGHYRATLSRSCANGGRTNKSSGGVTISEIGFARSR